MVWVGEPSEPTLCVEKDIYIYIETKGGSANECCARGVVFCRAVVSGCFSFSTCSLSLSLPSFSFSSKYYMNQYT